MVGEVSDLARKGALRVGVALQINVGVAVQVERRQPVYVLAQHRLPRLVQEEHLRADAGASRLTTAYYHTPILPT